MVSAVHNVSCFDSTQSGSFDAENKEHMLKSLNNNNNNNKK